MQYRFHLSNSTDSLQPSFTLSSLDVCPRSSLSPIIARDNLCSLILASTSRQLTVRQLTVQAPIVKIMGVHFTGHYMADEVLRHVH